MNSKLCHLSTSFVTVSKLLHFSKLQFSYLRPGANNIIDRLYGLNEIIYLERLGSALPALCWQSFGRAPPGSVFEN